MNQGENLPEADRKYPPSSPQEIDAQEVRRRYGFTLWVAAAACLLYGITLSAHGLWWPFGVGDLALCALFLFLRHWTLAAADNRRLTIGTHLMAAAGGALLFWHTWYSGLGDSFAAWYFALLPIAVALLGRLGIVAAWTLVSLLLIIAAHVVQRLWPVTPLLVLTPDLVAFAQMMLVLVATLYSIAALRANESHLDYLRRAYATLLEQRNLLDRQTAELNRSLRDAEQARAAADAASAAKSEFLAMMSHEIRTPLNGVIGLNTLLRDLPLDETARNYAELARQSGDALLALVNDFLDFSRIEAGGLTLEEVAFDPRRVMEESVNVVAASAREKGLGIHCEVDAPALLLGDPARLRQILVNLLANAVKFTAEGEIRLVSSPLPRAGAQAWLRIEVRDTGIGIDADAQQRLFQPFTQADVSTTRRYGGTGLGLAICRALAVHMGGQIG
ncbi:MAG: ATP-binding protein, partial [Gammaproteobacteria bacterium]